MAEKSCDVTQGTRAIKVIGVGGGGCNIVRLMVAKPTPGVDYLACNMDPSSLDRCGERVTCLEMGRSVEIPWPSGEFKIESGRLGAECPWFLRELKYHLKGADLVIMTAGMGGVTGTGGSPVIARVVKEMGIPLLAVVNTPYSFEGAHRSECAAKGILDLKPYVDNIIVVPCDFALRGIDKPVTVSQAFPLVDEIMVQGITSLLKLVNIPNLVCISPADVVRVMRVPGQSTVAFGFSANTECPAVDAAKKALGNTVRPVDLARARGALVSFTGGPNIRISDCAEAIGLIASRLDPQAAIAYGIYADTCVGDAVRVTLIATGIEPLPPPPANNWLKKLTSKMRT